MGPTPSGVPVKIRSPGSKVKTLTRRRQFVVCFVSCCCFFPGGDRGCCGGCDDFFSVKCVVFFPFSLRCFEFAVLSAQATRMVFCYSTFLPYGGLCSYGWFVRLLVCSFVCLFMLSSQTTWEVFPHNSLSKCSFLDGAILLSLSLEFGWLKVDLTQSLLFEMLACLFLWWTKITFELMKPDEASWVSSKKKKRAAQQKDLPSVGRFAVQMRLWDPKLFDSCFSAAI